MGPIRNEMSTYPSPVKDHRPYPPPHPKFSGKSTFQTFNPLPKSKFDPIPYPLRTKSLEELRSKPTSISFKTVPLSKSLQDLANMSKKHLSPKVTQAWIDIGKNYASLSPEPPNNAEETPNAAATEETATPSVVTWTTSSRTQTATATTPAQKVRLNHILILILTIAITFLLPTPASTCAPWPFSSAPTKLCELTLDIENTNDTQDNIASITNKVLEIRSSPIENPDGHLQDQVFKFHTVTALEKIVDLKKECNEDGNRAFTPLYFLQIADVLKFTKNTLILELSKYDDKYVIGPNRIPAPDSAYAIPNDSKYVTLKQQDKIEVKYLAENSALDASETYQFTCLHTNKDKKSIALLEASQSDLLSYSSILTDIIASLVKHYNSYTEEEDCIPIQFQPYQNTSFPTPPTYLTSSNANQVLGAIKDSKTAMKKIYKRANQLIENKFEVTKKSSSLWELFYNFNLSILSHIMIFLLTNLLIFLLCIMCCCLGACSYSRERTARTLLASS